MRSQMKRELASLAGSGKMVHLLRRQPNEPRLNGYLLAMSENLLLMHCFDDFEPDGYTICRVRDVVRFRHGPYEEWFDHMLHSEGLLGGLRLPRKIDISSLTTAVRSVARHYDQMTIECEDTEEAEEDFYIGKVVEVRARSIRFRDYDALGYWSSSPQTIKMNDITKVQFDTPYIKVFSKYTREGTPPSLPTDGF